MFTESMLRWGEYGGFAGYWFPGTRKLEVAPDADDKMRRYFIGCVTEGAGANSLNCYDRCRFSGGRFQITEVCSGWLVTSLLGVLMEQKPSILAPVLARAADRGYSLKRVTNRYGAWAWCDNVGPVHRSSEATNLFFSNGCDGKLGSWERGDANANAIVPFLLEYLNIWEDGEATAIQDQFLLTRMYNFVMAGGRSFLNLPNEGKPYLAAAQAAYLSFSLNNPTIALRMLDRARTESKHQIGTKDWCYDYLKLAVFGPNVAIYPHRYNDARSPRSSIRFHLERLYGVDLPDLAEDLQRWETAHPSVRTIRTAQEIQQGLIDLGYNLGPRGADGIFGTKTREAVVAFQRAKRLQVDGIVGPKTLAAMVEALDALTR